MFWKIFLTMFALGGVYLLGKIHARRGLTTSPLTLSHNQENHPTAHRATAIGVVMAAVLLFGWFLYHNWREAHQVVEVRVIQVQSGQVTLYQALKGDIHGRSFLSVDGRRITLADVERLEIGEEM